MARPDKAAAVAELTENFKSSAGAVLTEYRGLTVAQLRQLRTTLGDDVNYAVVKNTLTKIAAKDAGVESFDSLLEGPSAIAFIKGDPVVAANPLLVIKGGVLDGKALDSDEINRLADLESREVLLSKLAGAMKAAPQQAVSLFAAPLAQAARLFAALQDKLPAQDAPVADEAPAAEAVQDAPAEAPAEASTEETASADS
jgi:large subunit ribosomal protein L10